MIGNSRAILTGALLAAGAEAVLTTLGCRPDSIITSAAALLTTAITVLGPKLIELRGRHQLGMDIRWLIKHKVDQTLLTEIVAMSKEYQEKALDADVAAIEAARTETHEQNMKNSFAGPDLPAA